MKVLFAVNNENISESIIKKYQKDYKEILTYKNVYYFNAILKELQKDKSYDRIVISEDLEPFANNNYDIIDKFLFEKLDKISDEANDNAGNDTPIIVICTDRRTKSDNILVKLFGIGIYSAIIGQDRSIDEVCRLIYMPRTKKEAKIYYRIESDEVSYKTESENSVSEVEIQNILAHYKRLGKNTERYVDSFNNIAAQYTDSQLIVIAKFLPLNVKAVLESESPKYQELMTSGGEKAPKKQAVKYGTVTKPNKAEERAKKNAKKDMNLDAFETSSNQTNLGNTVVIPSAVGTNPTKIATEGPKPMAAFKPAPMDDDDDNDEENDDIELFNLDNSDDEYKNETPSLSQDNLFDIDDIDDTDDEEDFIQESVPRTNMYTAPVKKGRGRPRKITEESVEVLPEQPKKGRGRPRKNSEEVEDQFDDILPQSYNSQVESANLYGIDEDDMEDNDDSVSLYDMEDDNDDNVPQIAPRKVSQAIPEYDEVIEEKHVPSSPINPIISNSIEQEDISDTDLDLNNNKVVSFIGTTKNGTSFLINNVALILSSMGVNTAILDLTTNRNSYYIFTKNDEELRKVASESFGNLNSGVAKGIEINKFLTAYTAVPGEKIDNVSYNKMINTLRKHYSLILVDTDFTTKPDCYRNSNEIYLIQTMDILTIQPLTAFLRDLKAKDVLPQEKLRVVLNKFQKIRMLNEKVLIGGMSSYNDPAMTFMTDLFNKETITYVTLPFDMGAYSKYIEGLVTCELSTKGFSRGFLDSLKTLAALMYPTFSGPNKTNKVSAQRARN